MACTFYFSIPQADRKNGDEKSSGGVMFTVISYLSTFLLRDFLFLSCTV